MNKRRLGRISFSVTVALAVLIAMQAWSLHSMYADRRAEFARRVTQAMTRAAYDDLLLGNTSIGAGASKISFSKLGNIDSIKVDMISAINVKSLGAAGKSLSIKAKNDTVRYNIDVMENGTSRHIRQEVRIPSLYALRLNISRYDSLLTRNLLEAGIDLPHRVDVVRNTRDSVAMHVLTTQKATDGEVVVPSPNDTLQIADARTFTCPLTSNDELLFRLQIENPDRKLLCDMAEVILSSLLMLAVVAGALLYLLRTLFKQKTLEEMRIDLTHNITHELKTPIAVANAANDALLDFGAAENPERRERYLGVIREQLAALNNMVQRILTMSIEEREEFVLCREQVAMTELLENVVSKFRMKAHTKAEITVAVSPGDLSVWADRFHFSHALDNLVDNALKYSGEQVHVKLSASREANGVVLRVADDGIGIDRAAQAHIFEKFYRVPTGDRHDVKGFGLGLYYVRLIAEKHGGMISVESQPGRGTTFILTIPDHER